MHKKKNSLSKKISRQSKFLVYINLVGRFYFLNILKHSQKAQKYTKIHLKIK